MNTLSPPAAVPVAGKLTLVYQELRDYARKSYRVFRYDCPCGHASFFAGCFPATMPLADSMEVLQPAVVHHLASEAPVP